MNKKFKECLYEIYLTEQMGEMKFESILSFTKDEEARYIYGNLLQLETEAKAIMRPLLVKLGLPIEEKKLKGQTLEIIESFKELSLKEQFGVIYDSVKNIYLPQYEQLAMLLNEEDLEEAHFIANFMGDHERAIFQSYLFSCLNWEP